MSNLQPYFVRIANKLKLLLRQQYQLRKENERLRAGILLREQELQSVREKMAQMEERVVVMNAAAGQMEEKTRQEFEKKINQYIRDIDKVIVHLNE